MIASKPLQRLASSHKPEVGNILDDLKREIHREDIFKKREEEVVKKITRTDNINSRASSNSKKREITRIDSLTRVAVKNQDSFYNNSFVGKNPKNDINTTLNLDGDSILKPVTVSDNLKHNIGRDYLGDSIQHLSMIHPEEQSSAKIAMNVLKTIKSEIEDEEESMIHDTQEDYQPARLNKWGLMQTYHQSDTMSSAEPSGRVQFQHLKII